MEREFVESVIELAVTKACTKMAEERKQAIAEAMNVHVATCPTKVRLDKFQWLLLGVVFAGGALGGTALEKVATWVMK